jgi:hypothetical protein
VWLRKRDWKVPDTRPYRPYNHLTPEEMADIPRALCARVLELMNHDVIAIRSGPTPEKSAVFAVFIADK